MVPAFLLSLWFLFGQCLRVFVQSDQAPAKIYWRMPADRGSFNAMTIDCREFGYEAHDKWAQVPPGWSWPEVAGVATDSKDRVYVFNRGAHPLIVFNRDGSFRRS